MSSFSFSNVMFILLLLLLFFLISCFLVTATMTTTMTTTQQHPWSRFDQFVNAEKGMNVTGMAKLKEYFHHFGYLSTVNNESNFNFTDDFDDEFQSAVSLYQSKLGLKITGKLDSGTVAQLMAPRCGVSDMTTVTVRPHPATVHTVKHFAFFPGQPSWSMSRSTTLTYAFSSRDSINYISKEDIRQAFRRSFSRWEEVIPVSFMEINDYKIADIRIGFYKGDHGDGEPFDGVLGVLAHAFSPESGRLHLDKSERWAVDFKKEKADMAIDLESVATHEIGHVLGLAHSTAKDSVMYPSLSPRARKVNLRVDDVQGVQALYGTNPNFRYSSLVQSEMSPSSASLRLWPMKSVTVAATMMMSIIL